MKGIRDFFSFILFCIELFLGVTTYFTSCYFFENWAEHHNFSLNILRLLSFFLATGCFILARMLIRQTIKFSQKEIQGIPLREFYFEKGEIYTAKEIQPGFLIDIGAEYLYLFQERRSKKVTLFATQKKFVIKDEVFFEVNKDGLLSVCKWFLFYLFKWPHPKGVAIFHM